MMYCEVQKVGQDLYAKAPPGFVFVDLNGRVSVDIQLIPTPARAPTAGDR